MLTLGIESSCDETSAAVLSGTDRLLSNIVHSQIPVHARYGGVVPELASRNHIMAIIPVIERALTEAKVSLEEIDLIAVTRGPGLVGSLLIGLETAKTLAYLRDIPLLGVNHIEGHLLSPFVDSTWAGQLDFPYVALVVSGGHTSLLHVSALAEYTLMGRTLDDAAGEAFDKVAKRLGAPYPGGPYVERTARDGDPKRHPLPIPMRGRSLDFSFSGLKTATINLISRLENEDPTGSWIPDVCAAVQSSVVTSLLAKATKALALTSCTRLVIAGGVACNQALREAAWGLKKRMSRLKVVIPHPSLCTDNGAMIACAGALEAQSRPRSGFAQFDMDVDPSWLIGKELASFS